MDIEPSLSEPSILSAQDNSDSSSTWIEDDFEGEDAGRRREPFKAVPEHIQRMILESIIKPTSTLRIEELKESDTEDTQVLTPVAPEASEAPEAQSVSSDAVTLQINADAALAQQLAQEELIENMTAHGEAFEEIPSHEEIFRRELARMYNWKNLRMSSL
nr:hypothetical protein Iba_chr04aCG19300 [Ipomoea batatas]